VAVAAPNIVEARGVSKRYANGVLAVDAIDLNVRHGEVYGFLGPNGAGKTTTLRMLVGLIRPSSGHLAVAGGPPGSHQSLAHVGSVIESPTFWPYLSGRDNLRLLARYCGADPARVDPLLATVELTSAAKQHFSDYSTGMKQRLGVASALLKDPDLLILDEPTNGLDPQGMAEFRGMIKNLGKGERTVLLSSHLLAEVEQICTRVGVIRKGRMVAEGTLAELRGAQHVVIRATPLDDARAALEKEAGAGAVNALADGSFSVAVLPQRAALINRHLVEQGIMVSELRPGERSLEDVFFELTSAEAGA